MSRKETASKFTENANNLPLKSVGGSVKSAGGGIRTPHSVEKSPAKSPFFYHLNFIPTQTHKERAEILSDYYCRLA
jgi:hypothetical protein